MSNKQVVAIFIIGMALLLAAFWAGLFIVKQDVPASANQSAGTVPSQNAVPAQPSKPVTNANLTTPAGQPAANENAQYIVLVGTFGTLEQAKQLESDMRRDYIAAHVQMPSGGDNTLYRVVIGPYKKHDAEQVAADLSNKRKGIMIQPWAQN
ncbi:MAG TPA: SPOR domain-containing protein [Blastocatellia bacterium]|nr:SPOR domain-containing protein [Blastocatellia bacterium]